MSDLPADVKRMMALAASYGAEVYIDHESKQVVFHFEDPENKKSFFKHPWVKKVMEPITMH